MHIWQQILFNVSKHSLSNRGTWNSANTMRVQCHDNIETIHKLVIQRYNCLCLLGVFLWTLLCPSKNATQCWKPRHIENLSETIVDWSCVLLTIVKMFPKWGRSAGYRCRSDNIKPRLLNYGAKEVLFSIWVSSLIESFPKILLWQENHSHFYWLRTMN